MEMVSKVEIYETTESQVNVEVQFEGDTVWLSQSQMSELFDQTKQNISLHISNCFNEGELNTASTVKESLTVQKEGNRQVKRNTKYYNLDVIISVGYRVKSKNGTKFRIWATNRLKLLIKGLKKLTPSQMADKLHGDLPLLDDSIVYSVAKKWPRQEK